MENRIFTSLNGLELIIKSRKSAVVFEIDQSKTNEKYDFTFEFYPEDFSELFAYLEIISNKSWSNLIPKEADSHGSDYHEYYDKNLDNNGYLSISENKLSIERPSLESERLYQFNKKKMETFLFDFKKIMGYVA